VSAEQAAAALREAYPDADPFDVDWATLAGWIAAAGIDPDDDARVARTLVAWEQLL